MMLRALLFFAFIPTILGCAPQVWQDSSEIRGPLWFKLPIVVVEGESSEKAFQTIALHTLTSLHPFRGKAARFLVNPQGESPNFRGQDPLIFFVPLKEGIWLPQNTTSIRIVTLYYHFESLWEIDRSLNIDHLLPWPRTVLFDARVRIGGQDISHSNARYSPESDVYIFENYELSGTPITINSGVVAHEHFHALFQKLVIDRIESRELLEKMLIPPREKSEKISPQDSIDSLRRHIFWYYLIRGWNEGLADWWGYLVSQDKAFVQRSIPQIDDRNLDPSTVSLPKSIDLMTVLLNRNNHLGRLIVSYRMGTLLARQLVNKNQSLSREENFRKTIQFLQSLPQELLRIYQQNEYPDPNLPYRILSQE